MYKAITSLYYCVLENAGRYLAYKKKLRTNIIEHFIIILSALRTYSVSKIKDLETCLVTFCERITFKFLRALYFVKYLGQLFDTSSRPPNTLIQESFVHTRIRIDLARR